MALQASKGQGWDVARAAVRRGDSVHARAKHALWARPEHARDALDEMPGQPRVREGGWQLTGQGYG